jgi:hypothetical protein
MSTFESEPYFGPYSRDSRDVWLYYLDYSEIKSNVSGHIYRCVGVVIVVYYLYIIIKKKIYNHVSIFINYKHNKVYIQYSKF